MTDKTEYTGLEKEGIRNPARIYWHLPTAALYEEIIQRREGLFAHLGPLVVRTGHHTGRSPYDKFFVKEPGSESEIWWGDDIQPMSEEQFDIIYKRLTAYLQAREIFVQENYAGNHPKYQKRLRIITEYAWHSLFARNMFVRELDKEKLKTFEPEFTLIHIPKFHAIPEIDGTRSETFIVINLKKKIAIIGGSSYAGEMKKAIFTVMNYYLPKQEVLSMHCSANVGKKGDTAIFFGLSGTGKTTLSTDPERNLIGDDEHGWSDEGIFNIEGGCYAKVIRLSKEREPDIYKCTRKFGTILENVAIDSRTRRVDLDDNSLTENTRASYPITHLDHIVKAGYSGHPENLIFLTYDAFGVLPPVARLSKEQAMYHFISGYTAKVAGTEVGVTEPQAVFSPCYGAPFMVFRPSLYAKILGEKIDKHNVKVWMVNTGYTGGPYGTGKRFDINDTRTIVNAILNGKLDDVSYRKDECFKFMVPKECPGVSSNILNPILTWENKDKFYSFANKLANEFRENIKNFIITDEVLKEANPECKQG